MAIVKVLKRKDASSVIVAVVIALVVLPVVAALASELSYVVSGLDKPVTDGWQVTYLLPVANALLQLVALEVIIRLYAAAHDMLSK